MKLIAIVLLILCLSACALVQKPQVLDGPGSVYVDSDYRSKYANIFDFDSYDGQPYFAVAFLGYGDRMGFRQSYVEGLFASLGDQAIEQIGHIDYEGDEWYLVVPRYKEAVDIKNVETGEVYTIYNGEAFTVKCNLSELHPSLEISTEDKLSGHIFSPQIDGEGKLVDNPEVWDITDYGLLQDYAMSDTTEVYAKG